MTSEPVDIADSPSTGIRFVYVPALDLRDMRAFYTGTLELTELYYSEEEGLLAYDVNGFQFTIYEAHDAPSPPDAWATQPGWSGDSVPTISWSVELEEHVFREAVALLQAGTAVTLNSAPRWVGYWSFPCRDPMGYTVELSWPDPSPRGLIWS